MGQNMSLPGVILGVSTSDPASGTRLASPYATK